MYTNVLPWEQSNKTISISSGKEEFTLPHNTPCGQEKRQIGTWWIDVHSNVHFNGFSWKILLISAISKTDTYTLYIDELIMKYWQWETTTKLHGMLWDGWISTTSSYILHFYCIDLPFGEFEAFPRLPLDTGLFGDFVLLNATR